MVEQTETTAMNHFRRGGARRIFFFFFLLLQTLLVRILFVKSSRLRFRRSSGLRGWRDASRRLLGRTGRNVGVEIARGARRYDVRFAPRIHVNSCTAAAAAAVIADRDVGTRFRLRFVKIERHRFISGRCVVGLFVIVVKGNGGR